MVVSNDTVTFRFRLDAKEMKRLIQALERDARKFGSTMEKVGNDSQSAGNKIRASGNNAAATAVNFQTATQGMLNLSTAAVQTFTSFSNLDRAANRLAQAKIGVARATDLLNNKEVRLEELQKSGNGNTKKAAVLTNELATARADLAVKTDKARIEEGALLDIQLLFVSNIANVMISSIQTIKTLYDMRAISAIKLRLAETSLMINLKRLIIAEKVHIMTSKGVIATNVGMAFTIRGVTLSVKGLLIALGPIALVIGGISLAMHAWENNTHGFRDAVQELLPFLKEENSELDKASQHLESGRTNLEGYNDALGDFGGKLGTLSIPHQAYLKMMAEAAINLGNNRDLAKQYADQLVRIRMNGAGGGSFSPPSDQGGQPEQVKKSWISNLPVLSFPMAHAEEQLSVPALILQQQSTDPNTPAYFGEDRRELKLQSQWSRNFKGTQATEHTWRGDVNSNHGPHPFGSPGQIQTFNILPKKEKLRLMKILFENNPGPEFAFAIDEKLQEIMNSPDAKIISPSDNWKNIMKETKSDNFFGADNVKETPEDVIGNKSRFFFGNDIFKMKGFDQTHKDTPRGEIINLTGVDIGNVANSISENDGIRLANMQKRMRSFEGEGGQSGKIAQYLAQQGGMSKGTTGVLSGFHGSARDQAFNIALGNGSISATAAYQVDSVNWAGKSAWKTNLARGDSFVNGVGGMMLNAINMLKGGARIYSSGHRGIRRTISGVDVIVEAIRMGIKGMPEWMAMINEIPDVDKRSVDNMSQAQAALGAVVGIAGQYISMVNSAKSAIGFTSTTLGKAHAAGFSGTGLYQNISLLAATKRTNFSNTQIIEESKSKLSLTNSQTFAIRFNSTRGDAELQDRFRYVDQLEAMSSGTSPL